MNPNSLHKIANEPRHSLPQLRKQAQTLIATTTGLLHILYVGQGHHAQSHRPSMTQTRSQRTFPIPRTATSLIIFFYKNYFLITTLQHEPLCLASSWDERGILTMLSNNQATNQDGIALLVIIQSLIHTFEENRKLSDAIMDVKEKFYKFYQGRHMTLERYHELFLAQVEVLDEVGITIEDNALVMEVAEQNGRAVPNDDDRSEA